MMCWLQYEAQEDETLHQIAVKHSVVASELLTLNKPKYKMLTATAALQEGTLILIPAVQPLQTGDCNQNNDGGCSLDDCYRADMRLTMQIHTTEDSEAQVDEGAPPAWCQIASSCRELTIRAELPEDTQQVHEFAETTLRCSNTASLYSLQLSAHEVAAHSHSLYVDSSLALIRAGYHTLSNTRVLAVVGDRTDLKQHPQTGIQSVVVLALMGHMNWCALQWLEHCGCQSGDTEANRVDR